MGGAGPYYLAKAPAARAWEIPHQAGEKGKAIGEDSVPKGAEIWVLCGEKARRLP